MVGASRTSHRQPRVTFSGKKRRLDAHEHFFAIAEMLICLQKEQSLKIQYALVSLVSNSMQRPVSIEEFVQPFKDVLVGASLIAPVQIA